MRYLLLLVLTFFILSPAHAQAETHLASCAELAQLEWREARTQSFAILYPQGQEELGHTLFEVYGSALDAEYARFAGLYETGLSLPISIRLYPTHEHYLCLNALAPELGPGATHSHIGAREIALLGDGIAANQAAWLHNFLDIFRYEQSVLFVESISGQNAPPGLLAAAGYFAQDPTQTIGPLQLSQADWAMPGFTWRQLWEEPETAREFSRGLQTTTTVAFLVDAFGWEPFLRFLKDLPASGNYRQSLANIYGQDIQALQENWQSYYPHYFQGRWQAHPLYNYDLSTVQKLVDGGAYTDAGQQLHSIIPFLETSQQPEKHRQAQMLLAQAQAGQEANNLVVQARQALAKGDYAQAIRLIGQAEQSFQRLGNYHRLDELSAYRGQVQAILQLHEEVDKLRAKMAWQINTFSLAARLVDIDQRLGELGDVHGQLKARAVLEAVQARQRNQQLAVSLLGILFVLALLGLRIWLLRYKPAPEAEL